MFTAFRTRGGNGPDTGKEDLVDAVGVACLPLFRELARLLCAVLALRAMIISDIVRYRLVKVA